MCLAELFMRNFFLTKIVYFSISDIGPCFFGTLWKVSGKAVKKSYYISRWMFWAKYFFLEKFIVVWQISKFATFFTFFQIFSKKFSEMQLRVLRDSSAKNKSFWNSNSFLWYFYNFFQFLKNSPHACLTFSPEEQFEEPNVFPKSFQFNKLFAKLTEEFNFVVNIFRHGFWNFILGIQRNIFMWKHFLKKKLPIFKYFRTFNKFFPRFGRIFWQFCQNCTLRDRGTCWGKSFVLEKKTPKLFSYYEPVVKIFCYVSREKNSSTQFFWKKNNMNHFRIHAKVFRIIGKTLWQPGCNWILGAQNNILHDNQGFWRNLKRCGQWAKIFRNFAANLRQGF